MTRNILLFLLGALLGAASLPSPARSQYEDDKAQSGTRFLERRDSGGVSGADGVDAGSNDKQFDESLYTDPENREKKEPPAPGSAEEADARKAELKKGINKAASAGKGAVYGGVIGAVAGGVLGSVVPGAGTVAGIAVGASVGMAVGAFLGWKFGG